MLLNPARLTKTPRSSFEDEYVHAVQTLTAGIDRGRAQLLVATGQYVPLMQELNWTAFVEELNVAAERTLLRELTRTGQAALDEGVRLGNELGLVFDATNPQVWAWAQRHAAELVTAVTRQVRNALSAAVLEATAGIAPARLAPLLLDTGIGLTRPWMQAVLTRAEQLGVGAGDPRVQAYSRQLMRARGRMIARTEVMRAQNAGRMAGWNQATRSGVLHPDTAKIWTAGSRPCPQCAGLAGETVRVGENFSTGDLMPPAHPHCTCTAVLEFHPSMESRQGPALPANIENRIREMTLQGKTRKEIIDAIRGDAPDVTVYRVWEVQRRLGVLPGTPRAPGVLPKPRTSPTLPKPPPVEKPPITRAGTEYATELDQLKTSKQIVDYVEAYQGDTFAHVTYFQGMVPEFGVVLPQARLTRDVARSFISLTRSVMNVNLRQHLLRVDWQSMELGVNARYFPTRYFIEISQKISSAFERGWHPGTEAISAYTQTFTHEFGHYLWDALPLNVKMEITNIMKSGLGVENFTPTTMKAIQRQIARDVSQYGATNFAELWAETFSKAVLNRSLPSTSWVNDIRAALERAGMDMNELEVLLK